MKQISAKEAIARMREMRNQKNASFTLHHLTWNEKKQETKGLRVVERCRLRPALPGEVLKHAFADLYLTYIDLDLMEPRMCFKILMRAVAFPPNYELMKVNWFI